MLKVEYRDLFGNWVDTRRAFASLQEAHDDCVDMADVLNVAYRVIDDSGAVVDMIDFEADFWAIGKDRPNDT